MITFVDGAANNNAAAVPTYTVPIPSDGGALLEGDLLIAAWSWATPDTTPPARTLPTGWTSLTGIAIAGTATTTVGHEGAYHFVTAAEAGTSPVWTVDNGGSYIGNVSVSRFRGVDTADPFAMASPTFDLLARDTNGTSTAAPSVATDETDAMLVTGFGHRNGSGTITAPTDYTMGGHADLGAGRTTALAHKAQPVPGSSGAATWTHSNSVPAVAWQTALNPAPAQVEVAGSATLAQATSAQSLSCAVPAGVLAGELLVAEVTHSVSDAIPDQAGWTTAGKASGGNCATAMFYRYATASEPASYAFTGLNPAAAGRIAVEMVRLTGVHPSTPEDVPADTKFVGSGTAITTDALVTVTDGTLVLYGVSRQAASAGDITPAPGTTLLVNTTGSGRRTILCSEERPVAGDTGTRTFNATDTTALGMAAVNTAFRPAAGGSAAPTAPAVSAGADATVMAGASFVRTATENDGGAAITSRAWSVVSGPAEAGNTIGTAAALSWVPTVAGSYVLRYSASNSVGTTTDDLTLTVSAATSDFARVQFASGGNFTTGSATNNSGALPTLPTPATAGNALIGMWAVDKNSGAFTPPAGWTVLGEIVGTSVSMLVCGKVAAGGETTATATWATATEGYSTFLAEYTGTTASPFGPISAPAYNDVARTSMALGPVTATANSRAIAMFDIDSIRSGGAQLDFSPTAAGWGAASIGQAPQVANGVPGAVLVEASNDTANAATVPATTFSWTASDQVNGMMVLLNTQGEGGGPGPAGTLVFAITGDPDGDSVPVRVKTAAAASVRLKVATNAGMSTGVAFTTPVAPDANQYSLHTVSGLAAGTHYWYQVEVDGVLAAPVGEFITDTPVAARSFRVAFGSCLTSDNATRTAFDDVIANDPELFLHLGDWHYDNSLSTSAATHRTSLEDQITINGGLRDLIRLVPTAYTWSDHDSGNDNWTGGPAAWTPSYNSAYRDVFPTGTPMPDSGGVYRSIHRGRVKFIITDCRSFKSPSGNTDNATKTMFGTAQEAWIASELADPNYPVKVLCVDVPWVFATTAGEDKWGGYKAAAQRLVDDIVAADANVFLIHGDAHSLCADDGTSANNTGGLPVAGAAPFGNSSSIKGGPYSQGTWPTAANIGAAEQQHGLLDITDTGSEITIRFSGRDKTNTERVTLTAAWATSLAPPTGLTVTPASSTQLDVTWDTVAAATGYDLERDGVVILTDYQSTSYSDTGLAEASAHSYRVRSVG